MPPRFAAIGSAIEFGSLPLIMRPNVALHEPLLQLAKLTVARYVRWGTLWQSQRGPL